MKFIFRYGFSIKWWKHETGKGRTTANPIKIAGEKMCVNDDYILNKMFLNKRFFHFLNGIYKNFVLFIWTMKLFKLMSIRDTNMFKIHPFMSTTFSNLLFSVMGLGGESSRFKYQSCSSCWSCVEKGRKICRCPKVVQNMESRICGNTIHPFPAQMSNHDGNHISDLEVFFQ